MNKAIAASVIWLSCFSACGQSLDILTIVRAKDKLAYDGVEPLARRIAEVSESDLRATLPSLLAMTAVENPARVYNASFALLCVAARPDGSSLLAGHLPRMLDLLSGPDSQVARLMLQSVLLMKDVPAGMIVPQIIQFVGKPQGAIPSPPDEEVQAAAIAVLVQYEPNSRDVMRVITGFLSRKLAPRTRIVALQGLGSLRIPGAASDQLISLVLMDINHSDWIVREAAINTISRIGPAAAYMSGPKLSAIAADEKELPAIRTAAREAFLRIQGAPSTTPF